MRLLPAAVACAALLVTGCGADGAATGARPTGTASSGHPGPGPDAPDAVRPVGDGDIAESVATGGGPAVTVTDVRLGTHDGFDRIVFEVAGDGLAGWQVGWVDEPRAPGSGAPVEVPGQAFLGITLTNIALPGDAGADALVWQGPQRQAVAGAAVLEALVDAALVEGRYSFFAGTDERRPFAVGTANSPQRIVVDLFADEVAPPVALSQRCDSPAGFSVSYPEGWSVNLGETVAACTRFAPEPFTVPPGTDARVGAVTASVQQAPFEQVAGPGAGRELSRGTTTVGGRPAVRVERISVGEGLWPAGVPTTGYVVDLGSGAQGPRTLVIDTVGLPQFDYARNVPVLDRMVETLTFPDP
ncbi:AMIN-like domain-containing (lipo)protein [Blastococcus saxobsidens]|uniref:AMIN-like domain-containing protein n=1 Tax=Blastococcus saxobsidens TaxID=138336 RepID=A0A4Q7Y5N3_9ACTN|nr:hypothetical protein [Blastococcus saxobsidens]RZU31235.1 hypothetical protein BKA19_0891 [Blastococcus saxobsidens]